MHQIRLLVMEESRDATVMVVEGQKGQRCVGAN